MMIVCSRARDALICITADCPAQCCAPSWDVASSDLRQCRETRPLDNECQAVLRPLVSALWKDNAMATPEKHEVEVKSAT